jgi:hypothetical protein
MKTNKTLFISFTVFLILCQSALAIQPEEKAAKNASDAWLSLVDNGNYAGSWQEGAEYFKNAVGESQWVNAMNAVRRPLGKVLSRKLISQNYTQTLPGAPDGEYVVIHYQTSFENKASAIETVTPVLDKDRTWRVSGYYIK